MTRTEAAETIQHIRRLHEIATPISDISRAVHLPIRAVESVLRTGTFPEEQPHWITTKKTASGDES